MDVVVLPSVPSVTTLEEAHGILLQAQRSGLVTEIGGTSVIVTAAEIVLGIGENKERLADLTPFTPVESVELPAGVTFAENARDVSAPGWEEMQRHISETPLGTEHKQMRVTFHSAAFSGLVESLPGSLGVLRLSPGAAVVLTQHETDGDKLAARARPCYCTNPNERHGNDRNAGMMCDRCPYPILCHP